MGSFLSNLFIDPETLPHDGYGAVQLVSLLLAYAFVLSKSSNLISDGSELLLLIPSVAGIVGSVVLPVLGAVPDGAIVLFSGLGDISEAQEQLSVGVGALAGSTIMLLTIPWASCILTGRVDLDHSTGEANYKAKPRLSAGNKFSLFGTGVTPRASIGIGAKIMFATSFAYFIIQGAAFGAKCSIEDGTNCDGSFEHWFALAALLVCVGCFIGYMWYNIKHADDEDREDFVAEIQKQAIEHGLISLSGAFEEILKQADVVQKDEGMKLLPHEVTERDKRFHSVMRSFFTKYDADNSGTIDRHELKALLKDFNENPSEEHFNKLLNDMDTDKSGDISFSEFAAAMTGYVARRHAHRANDGKTEEPKQTLSVNIAGTEGEGRKTEKGQEEDQEGEEEEEEEEEVPEDLASLPPATQRRRILWRSIWMMGLGTLVVLVFSDAMVDVLSELADRIGISAFYVAFVLAPIASNASELIASINYASKKTKKTITISLSTLLGAGSMNNTFCLAIFLALIFFRPQLVWSFSAETISIIFVQVVILMFTTFRKTEKLFDAIIVISLYPLSLALVYVLENVAGLN